jgi:HD-like signal output (HDOD) protein
LANAIAATASRAIGARKDSERAETMGLLRLVGLSGFLEAGQQKEKLIFYEYSFGIIEQCPF